MTKFEINGVELVVNMLDAEENERITAAITASGREAEAAGDKEYGSEAEGIRATCAVVSRCFDAIFGEGTGARVLGGKSDIAAAVEAHTRLIDAVNADRASFSDFTATLRKRYSSVRARRDQR